MNPRPQVYQTCTLPTELHSYKAPHTGFEPASPSGPTVFRTAPSPPGHTAYKFYPLLNGSYTGAKRIELIHAESKSAALPLHYAPITTGGRFELPDPLKSPAFQTGAFDHYAIRPLLLVPLPSVGGQWYDSGWIRTTGTLNPFNSLAGSRNRPTLPRCHITAPNLSKNTRFGAVSYLRQDSNLQSTD